MKSASYKLALRTAIEISPLSHGPDSTELCKQKLINPHPTAQENSQKGTGEYGVYLHSHLMGFRLADGVMSKCIIASSVPGKRRGGDY